MFCILNVSLIAYCVSRVSAEQNNDVLNYAHVGEVESLDPAYPYDAVSQGLILNIYETLIGFQGSSLEVYEPLLATHVPSLDNGLISKDGLKYTFPIRRGVRFQDGSEMVPEDVRYSILRFMLQDHAGGPSSLLLEPIMGVGSTRDGQGKIQLDFKEISKAVRVKGDKVVIRLKRPFAPFLSIMARWSYVVSKPWAVAHGDWDGKESTWQKYNNPNKEDSYFFNYMNGTGPFMLERWDRATKSLFLLSHDRYWRKPPFFKRIVMNSVPEFSTRRLLLQGGGADIIDVPRSLAKQVREMKGVRFLEDLPRLMTDPVLFFTFDINPQANPDIGSGKLDGDGVSSDFFKDRDLRKGFAYAFDYDRFLNDAFGGKAQRAKGSIPPGLPGYYPAQEFHAYDPQKAKEYFQKAWGGQVWQKGFQFTLTYNTGGELRELACRVLKKGVEGLNPKFKIDVRGVEWASFLDKTQKKMMPMWSRGWFADYPDPHNFAFPFFHSQGRYAIAQGYHDQEMNRLVEAAVREVEPLKRQNIYFKIQELAFQEVPQIYTVHPSGLIAMSETLQGFVDNPVFMGIYFYPIHK
ncbi:MAG: ABC transporter substrate-binding protein [Elusimicrobia bacterium]|nr:ABC transporter substrate-binding protein [Elusimicrobiota bacterium]